MAYFEIYLFTSKLINYFVCLDFFPKILIMLLT
jgi:hypothetical protein